MKFAKRKSGRDIGILLVRGKRGYTFGIINCRDRHLAILVFRSIIRCQGIAQLSDKVTATWSEAVVCLHRLLWVS